MSEVQNSVPTVFPRSVWHLRGAGRGRAGADPRTHPGRELCSELGIRPVTLYRYVGPQGRRLSTCLTLA